jgi:hypothetical protein
MTHYYQTACVLTQIIHSIQNTLFLEQIRQNYERLPLNIEKRIFNYSSMMATFFKHNAESENMHYNVKKQYALLAVYIFQCHSVPCTPKPTYVFDSNGKYFSR